MRRAVSLLALSILLGVGVGRAEALSFSFSGNLLTDDQVLLFNFDVTATSLVTLRTYSYAGGVNAAGETIARGGFDPILALFSSAGVLIDENDDGGCGVVPADALSDACWDTFLQTTLNPGTYTVSVMEYDNFSIGLNLSNGFERQGQGNFTAAFSCPGNVPFQDITDTLPGCQRDSHWAFDVLNVAQATGPGGTPAPVPEPGTICLLGLGVAGLARRRIRCWLRG